MFRILIGAIIVFVGVANTSWADDYLLQIDCVGYENLPLSDAEASQPLNWEENSHSEQTFYCVELLVQSGARFHNKIRIANRTLTCTGKLIPEDHGGFSIELKFDDVVESVPGPDGDPVPARRDVTGVNSNIAIELEKPIRLGGLLSNKKDASGKRQSKVSFVVTLKKLDPKK